MCTNASYVSSVYAIYCSTSYITIATKFFTNEQLITGGLNMRLHSIQAINSQTGDKQVFSFGAGRNARLVTDSNDKADKYLAFCLGENISCEEDVTLHFSLDGQEYSLTRTHALDAKLSRVNDGEEQLLAEGSNVAVVLNELLGTSPASLTNNDLINQQKVDQFDGDLSVFKNIQVLTAITAESNSENEELIDRKRKVQQKIQRLAETELNYSGKKQLIGATEELNVVKGQIEALQARINSQKAQNAGYSITSELIVELQRLQSNYDKMLQHREGIDEQREIVRLVENVRAVLPKVERMTELQETQKQLEESKEQYAVEVDAQSSQLSSMQEKWSVLKQQNQSSMEQNQKVEVLQRESEIIARLNKENEQLNANLQDLQTQLQDLETKRDELKNSMLGLEETITSAKQTMNNVQFPEVSINEVLELVRLNVMLDEACKQRDQLTLEIEEKQKQLTEREATCMLQAKRFESVTQLDARITSLKAKDALLKVIDARCNKIELVNNTLLYKKRNLQAAQSELDTKLMELEYSKKLLEDDVDKMRLIKQEEFKREVLLNTQKLTGQDQGNVYAVTTNLQDPEITTKEQDIKKRILDYEVALAKRNQLKGRITEIDRQMEINEADISMLKQEKTNIINRYNEIIANSRNEDVNSYLRALEENNGTQYLLQAQQDVVRNDIEAKRINVELEELRNQLADVKARINSMEEQRQQLDAQNNTIDSFMGNNDTSKVTLEQTSDAMVSSYDQYKTLSQQLDDISGQYVHLKADIAQVNKALEFNNMQIERSNEIIKAFGDAESDSVEKVLDDNKVQIETLQENANLSDSISNSERELFDKRLEYERIAFTLEQTNKELDMLSNDLHYDMAERNITMDDVTAYKGYGDISEKRATIEEYDTRLRTLAEAIESHNRMLQRQPDAQVVATDTTESQQLVDLQTELDDLQVKRENLEKVCQDNMDKFIAGNNTKVRFAVAATELINLKTINNAIRKNDMIKVLAEDKIKTILSSAQRYLRSFTGEQYSLECEGSTLKVRLGKHAQTYQQLDARQKAFVYISLMFGIPKTDNVDCTWVLFSQDLKLKADDLKAIMNRVVDKDCLISIQ